MPLAVDVDEALPHPTPSGEPAHAILPAGFVQPLPQEQRTPDAEGAASVDHYVQLALARHPRIMAARQRVSAAAHRIAQEEALPDPMLTNVFWPIADQALQTAGGRMGHQMALMQQVPWPTKRQTKGLIASREVEVARAEVEQIEREIAEAVQLAYYELWYAEQAVRIVRQTRELVDDLNRVAEARYRTGGSQQDVLRAQLERDRLDDQLVTLQRQREVAQADLAALLQQPVDLAPRGLEAPELNDVSRQLDDLLQLAEQCNPQLRGLAAQVARDRSRQQLACLQQYPDLQLGMAWGLITEEEAISPVANGHDNISFTLGVSLPIWHDKINAGIREAAHRTASSRELLEAERDELYGRLRRLVAQVDALSQQHDIFADRIIPRTEQTLRVATADYRGERVDFSTLIETYRELLMFQVQLARIEANLAQTLAQLERTVGCPTIPTPRVHP